MLSNVFHHKELVVRVAIGRENLNGHCGMDTGKWRESDRRKASRSFSHFSPVFDRFCTSSLVFTLFGLSVSDRFWPSVFALFRAIRLLPFSGCRLDSPELVRHSLGVDDHQPQCTKLTKKRPNLSGSWEGTIVTRKCSYRPEAPKNSKTRKNDAKVAFGGPGQSTPKNTQSYSKVARK